MKECELCTPVGFSEALVRKGLEPGFVEKLLPQMVELVPGPWPTEPTEPETTTLASLLFSCF